jgi:hypothetical protein
MTQKIILDYFFSLSPYRKFLFFVFVIVLRRELKIPAYFVARYKTPSGEPCADSLPASPDSLSLCVSKGENKAGQGVN